MRVIILRGISGSGKSTFARSIVSNENSAAVFSSDEFFEGDDGVYKFDPTKLQNAHDWCLRSFVQACIDRIYDVLVVDNTNTTAIEIAPYFAIAKAFGCVVEIVTLKCSIDAAHQRNKHNVPWKTVGKQFERLTSEERKFPAWWKSCSNSVNTTT
jgi:predicted kinase